MTTPRMVLLLPIAALTLAGCGGDAVAREDADVRASGSSTVYPITEEAARQYQRSNRDATIHVEFDGTTSGFRDFCAGEVEISNASRPIDTDEMAACADAGIEFIEVPIAMDALAIVVHPDNDWATDITGDELAALWSPDAEDTITSWQQVRPSWPDRPLALFGRGTDSGTFDYFTTRIVGELRSIRSDYTASEDISLLVEGISDDPEALGFMGVGGYFGDWEILEVLPVDSGAGPVYPSLEAAQGRDYRPLTRPLFIYVNAAALEENPVVEDFVLSYLGGVGNWVAHTGYFPLDSDTYELAREHFEARRPGSFYDGRLDNDEPVSAVLDRAAQS